MVLVERPIKALALHLQKQFRVKTVIFPSVFLCICSKCLQCEGNDQKLVGVERHMKVLSTSVHIQRPYWGGDITPYIKADMRFFALMAVIICQKVIYGTKLLCAYMFYMSTLCRYWINSLKVIGPYRHYVFRRTNNSLPNTNTVIYL